ncbi:MAG TPA: hypothetical protein VLX33_02120, partial [Nitrososphaerales archaeon]|nr:hypothetical protein [Nitrososphaerales archaeon]
MSQVGMAAAGTAVAIGSGALGPGAAGVRGGLAMAGQSLGGLAMNNPTAGIAQKAGAALGGFGGGFARSMPNMAQNMVLMGTVGTLGGLGAGRSMSGVNRAIELKTPGQTTQHIVSFRAGALANELELPGEMKPYFDRALSGGMGHERIRELDVRFHNNLSEFQSVLADEVRRVKGIA